MPALKTATKKTAAKKAPTKRKSSKPKKDVYAIVTDKIVEMLEAGTAPWHKPWNNPGGGLPRSLSTGKNYRGVNVFLLGMEAMIQGYDSPWWGTYDQIIAKGGQVRAKQESTLVIFWTDFMKEVVNEVTGAPELRKFFVLRYFNVFNAEQADWQDGKEPAYSKVVPKPAERIAAAEAIMKGYPNGPKVRHSGNAAFYRPSTDVITLPPIGSFDDIEEYYSTAFHEQGHSTGAEKRLNREGVTKGCKFGDSDYSKEELVAEMTAAMLSAIAGLKQIKTLPNSAAYLASWIRVLRGDSKLVVQAAAQAQKAADHILGVTFEKE